MGQGQPVEAIPVVAEPVQSSMYQEIVRQAETVVSTVEDAEDETSPNGSFWGGITED
jgi:type II secretory pathway predicted ATPase ExeA